MRIRVSRSTWKVAAVAWAFAAVCASVPASAEVLFDLPAGLGVNFGYRVASAGDFDGDGYEDLLLGALLDPTDGIASGRAYLFRGGEGTGAGDIVPDLFFTSPQDTARLSSGVDCAGDVNGDGYDDIVIGAYLYNNGVGNSGLAYVFFGGGPSGGDGDNVPDMTLAQPSPAVSDQLGWSVAGAGDVNGDGYDDVIVGSHTRNAPTVDEGAAYVFFGGPAPNSVADWELFGEAPSNFLGYSVDGAGDVNGDGYDDVIVGAYGYDGARGRAYVFFGGTVPIDDTPDLIFTGTAPGDYFGVGVAGGGDFNGDGAPDLLVGSYLYTEPTRGASQLGRVDVFHGGPAADNASDWHAVGVEPLARLGFRVNFLGDQDGDGSDEVAAGMHNSSAGTSAGGRAVVFLGGTAADDRPDYVVTGTNLSGSLGWSVAGSDFDGDGRQDLVAGAPFDDSASANGGRVRVYHLPAEPVPVRSGTVGASTDVTLEVADDASVASATLYYRRAGTPGFSSVAMTDNGGTTPWTGTVPGTAFPTAGAQYYMETDHGSFVLRHPFPDGFYTLAADLSDFALFDLPADQYALRAVSLEPTNPALESVFDELGGYNPAQWRYGRWNGTGYDEGGAAGPVAPGNGFWVIAKDGGSIRTGGLSASLDGDAFAITLNPGFNQIGNPYLFPVNLPGALPPDVVANLYGWNGTGYVPFQPAMLPQTGYWIENTSDVPQVIGIQSLVATVAREATQAAWELREGESGWTVEVVATCGDARDGFNRIGMREQATDGRDAADFSDAPTPPGGYVQLSFLDDEDRRLLIDTRARSPVGAAWRMVLQSDRIGKSFEVRTPDVAALPGGFELVAVDGTGANVVDLAAGERLEGIVSSAVREREWTLLAGTPEFLASETGRIASVHAAGLERVSLGAGPNPFRSVSGTSLTLSLPAAGHARLELFDVSGRRVRTLADERFEAGAHRLAWDGRDEAGTRVAAGVYFARVGGDVGRAETKVVVLR